MPMLFIKNTMLYKRSTWQNCYASVITEEPCLLIQKYFCTVYDYVRKKKILVWATGIQKEPWDSRAFLKIIRKLDQKAVKYKVMFGVFSQVEALLSLKNVWFPPIFFLDTKSTC